MWARSPQKDVRKIGRGVLEQYESELKKIRSTTENIRSET
jgi:hypothetical protein